ncbi:TM0106 family RecB-like putative nuclease [soil metagenome]
MFFATDIANFLACPHIATLKREEAEGRITKIIYADPGAELLRRLGLAHEEKYLNELKARGIFVVEVPTDTATEEPGRKPTRVPWAEAEALTREAMVAGAAAIYQATFVQPAWGAYVHDEWASDGDGGGRDARGPTGEDRGPTVMWGGRADFLIRVETPSKKLGSWSYEVVETKLAKSTKAGAIIQLCLYSELVEAIQGTVPEKMHVVLGGGARPEVFSVQRYLAYFRKIKRDFQAAIAARPVTFPEPVEHCGICDWFSHCDERWHTEDHLSLVAGITRNQRKALVEREVTSVVKLGSLTLPVTPKIERIAPAPLKRIREQARVQVEGREKGEPVYELTDPNEATKEPAQADEQTEKWKREEAERRQLYGLAALPSPSHGDLFLDFEGDPFAFEQGLEYLIGMVMIAEDGTPTYDTLWSFDPAAEKKAFVEFIRRMKELRTRYPNMHIYHYAPYEPTAIKHLAGRHGVCADEVDELLRAEVFVDLYRVVRQGLRASVESYSIKKMEPFYGFTRTVPLRDARSSLQAFETVLALGDEPENAQEILSTIAGYNRDDCVSTWRLREWLETLRGELEAKLGSSIPRPELKSGAPSDDLEEQLSEIAILKERLVAGLPEQESEWTNDHRAGWLLAQMLEWHRREEKSMWWEYFRLCDLSDDELVEDKNALGGLVYQGVVEETKRSFVHRYKFPVQDHTINRARNVHDPRTQGLAGEMVRIDESNRTVHLKRGKSSEKPHPTALIADNYVSSKEQVKSLLRIARWVAEKGLQPEGVDSSFRAARDCLLGQSPRLKVMSIPEGIKGLSPLEAAKKLALALDSSILPIQGPPGSGKTYTGAHMVLELIRAGKLVGITAGSHKVISNLLAALCKAAEETHTNLSIVQKPNEFDGCEHAFVTQTDDNGEVLDKLHTGEAPVAAGTAWLWSREEMAGAVDVLFIDEAGQMSLANVLAVSPAAKSVVLLGDPQQLDQPQKGVHPPGAEVSGLAHLLNGRATIEPHQGLFLAESWRLHPDICAFTSEVFYDGRLRARSENAQQRLNAEGPLDGTGLRFLPVNHTGNQSDSMEEVARITELVEGLLQAEATWTNKEGETDRLKLKDILIVAPYNAQVALLARTLLDGARVGTVDKFQGQEAPVVIYSMTTSTPEDAPRGMEFLYSSNRLNVASSRAQCVTVLVANPGLFEVQCKTPRQIELANAFCRYLEMAKVV